VAPVAVGGPIIPSDLSRRQLAVGQLSSAELPKRPAPIGGGWREGASDLSEGDVTLSLAVLGVADTIVDVGAGGADRGA
jgi:hypothetical protein